MSRDPLALALKVRRIALENARRSLVMCQATETRAKSALDAAKARLFTETRVASATDAECVRPDTVSAWFQTALADLATAEVARKCAVTDSLRARAELADARGGYEATQEMIAQKNRALQLARSRHEQTALDEATLWRRLRETTSSARDDALNAHVLHTLGDC